ncbi:hypothetical protein EST38_g11447 [Candolleomyces aberdarensis]|uniref:Uncharacterized protein n=1 Tax=Candolleomyces aberdarensis TaxID=2316362 RepID=A0A4Q2D6C3_9AGAR|nr:hypothetical protein EST38_g11447 [Candolleomyces aberdarensis]
MPPASLAPCNPALGPPMASFGEDTAFPPEVDLDALIPTTPATNDVQESTQICDDNWELVEEEQETLDEDADPLPAADPSPLQDISLALPSNSNSTPTTLPTHSTYHIPVALHIPHSKIMENKPDPFLSTSPTNDGTPATSLDVHPQDGIYILYMLVTWLHLQFHLPFPSLIYHLIYGSYRTANLMLSGIMPGPKEQPPDECQHFCRIYVNELIRLWKHGFTVPTQQFPAGRHVRVILICICCDKPAAHKLGGFGSHSHTFFCTRCWIKQADKMSPQSFQPNGFRARSDAEHRAAGERYANLTTNAARDDFVKQNAVRWSEFARLPYFDLVRCIVIDPMHNLLLGLVKTHFYHIWVQSKILRKTKELNALHKILVEFTMPSYLGRLPALIGEPAGGSLTADQWLVMAPVVAPIAIPKIWSEFMSSPELARTQRANAIQARLNKKKKAAQARKKKAAAKKSGSVPTPNLPNSDPSVSQPRGAGDREDGDDEVDDDLPSCLHPDDPANFMKLSQALRLLLQRQLSDHDINVAEELLRSYCTELITLYGADVIRPNHHYAMHTPGCVRDFGPMHEFWTFLFERLNKVLKSYKTNNQSGGVLETTFFREFHRSILTSRLVARAGSNDSSGVLQMASSMMFKASSDDRGTVQALAQELDEANIDDSVIYAFSPRFETRRLDSALYYRLLNYLSTVFPSENLRSWNEADPLPGSVPLVSEALFFDYVIIQGRRYHASHRAGNAKNSMVEVFVSQMGNTWIGELQDIIQIEQKPSKFVLGSFRWLQPLALDLSQSLWQTYTPLGVQLWDLNANAHPARAPSPFLPLRLIKCHVATYETVIDMHPCVATLSIQKH